MSLRSLSERNSGLFLRVGGIAYRRENHVILVFGFSSFFEISICTKQFENFKNEQQQETFKKKSYRVDVENAAWSLPKKLDDKLKQNKLRKVTYYTPEDRGREVNCYSVVNFSA